MWILIHIYTLYTITNKRRPWWLVSCWRQCAGWCTDGRRWPWERHHQNSWGHSVWSDSSAERVWWPGRMTWLKSLPARAATVIIPALLSGPPPVPQRNLCQPPRAELVWDGSNHGSLLPAQTLPQLNSWTEEGKVWSLWPMSVPAYLLPPLHWDQEIQKHKVKLTQEQTSCEVTWELKQED